MPQSGERVVSPMRRIRVARGLTMQELSVFAGVSYPCIRIIDRLDPKKIGTMKIETVLRVALTLECSPVDLIPFLATRVKGKGKKIIGRRYGKGQFRPGENRSMHPKSGFGISDTADAG